MGKFGQFLQNNVLPALPIVGQVASGLIDARTAKRNTDRTNQANLELSKYQYNKDLEMWNKANLYNSPVEQRKRLAEAGINPNISAGITSTGTTATALPKYQAPNMSYNYKSPVDPSLVISRWQDYTQRQAQIDLLREQKVLTEKKQATEEQNPERIKSLIAQATALVKKYGVDTEKNQFNLSLDYAFGRQERNWNLMNTQNKYWQGVQTLSALRRQNLIGDRTINDQIQNWSLRNKSMMQLNKVRDSQLQMYSFDIDRLMWDKTMRDLGIDRNASPWLKLGASALLDFNKRISGFYNNNPFNIKKK